MRTLRRIAAVLGMALGAGAVWVAFLFYQMFSSPPILVQWGTRSDYVFCATLASLGLALVVVAYCFGFRWGAEPGAPPNGGPALPPANSGTSGGRHRRANRWAA